MILICSDQPHVRNIIWFHKFRFQHFTVSWKCVQPCELTSVKKPFFFRAETALTGKLKAQCYDHLDVFNLAMTWILQPQWFNCLSQFRNETSDVKNPPVQWKNHNVNNPPAFHATARIPWVNRDPPLRLSCISFSSSLNHGPFIQMFTSLIQVPVILQKALINTNFDHSRTVFQQIVSGTPLLLTDPYPSLCYSVEFLPPIEKLRKTDQAHTKCGKF